jgi:hypothetical protein
MSLPDLIRQFINKEVVDIDILKECVEHPELRDALLSGTVNEVEKSSIYRYTQEAFILITTHFSFLKTF